MTEYASNIREELAKPVHTVRRPPLGDARRLDFFQHQINASGVLYVHHEDLAIADLARPRG
jgi:hypothetical protein